MNEKELIDAVELSFLCLITGIVLQIVLNNQGDEIHMKGGINKHGF